MLRRSLLFVISLTLAIGLAHYFFGGITSFFDITPPEVQVIKQTKYVGLSGFEFEYKLEDFTGISRVRYQLFQGKRRILERVIKTDSGRQTTLKIPIDPQNATLKQGVYTIRLTAFDSSIRANRIIKEYNFVVDFTRPRISLVTNMHNIRKGGIELVFFEILNDASYSECVFANKNRFFPSISAENLGIKTRRNLRGIFFSLDLEHGGNLGLISYARNFDIYAFKFPYLVLNFKSNSTKISESTFKNIASIQKALLASSSSFRLEDCERVAVEPCSFASSFSKPLPRGSYYASFGQTVYYSLENSLRLLMDVFWIQEGIAEVVAPFDGYIEEYDNQTLVINYGCGFRSHIHPVEELRVSPKSKIERKQVLGLTSQIISAFVGHQISLWGHPINNRELEDANWVADHLVKKVDYVKELLAAR